MAEDERDRAFRAARRASARRLTAIQRDTDAEVRRILAAAAASVRETLAGQPTDYQRWALPRLKRQIEAELAAAGERAGAAIAGGAALSHEAGAALIDGPLKAGGIAIEGRLQQLDTTALRALESALTGKLANISLKMANGVNGELGLVLAGVRGPAEAASAIQTMIVKGGRTRALTIVRTELGRAFSAAAQARAMDAAAIVPGLKKQWRRSGKIHSRPEHDAADGQVKAVDEPFLVGGVALMYPRDPAGPPSATINCGCVSLPFMEDWDMSEPGRRPFSPEELAASPVKRLLADLEAVPESAVPDVGGLAGLGGDVRRARLIQTLEEQDPDLARAKMAGLLQDAGFSRFLAGGESGDYPVAVVPRALLAGIGGQSQVLRLSRVTQLKQLLRHPEIDTSVYANLQSLLDTGAVGRSTGAGRPVVGEVQGRWYKAVVKATKDGRQSYLQSYTLLRPSELSRLQRLGLVP